MVINEKYQYYLKRINADTSRITYVLAAKHRGSVRVLAGKIVKVSSKKVANTEVCNVLESSHSAHKLLNEVSEEINILYSFDSS